MHKGSLKTIVAPSVAVAAAAGVVGWLLVDQLVLSSSYEPLLSREVTPVEELPAGFMVWSSNRSGNHDIFKMTLPEREITRLTSHPHVDYHPRVSPDGSRIVFARSRKPGMSTRNQLDWNVMMLDLETGEERMLAEFGNVPTWSADGRKVYYQYRVEQFGEYDLEDGEHRVVFHAGMGQVRKGAGLQTPHLSPDGKRVAVTLRFKQHLIGIVDFKGRITRIADGCQLTWSPSGDFLYYVDYGGRMKNAIYVYEPSTGESRMALDLPGEFSHEYFPKLSDDERYMVFGASRSEKAHEHDKADFEMFLWQIGTPVENVRRLTFNRNNDNYPDIHLYGK